MPVDYQPPQKIETSLALNCSGSDYKLDIGSWTPARSALTFSGLYVNVDSFKLKDATKPGRLRFFMRRAAWNGKPVDDTFFDDVWLPVNRDGWGTLVTRTFFEWADGGRPLSWRYECDGLLAVSLKTRFVKAAQVY